MLHDEVRALADVVSPVDHDRVMAIADEVEAVERVAHDIEQFRESIVRRYEDTPTGCGHSFGEILCWEIHSNGQTFEWLAEKWGITVSFLGDIIADHCRKLDGSALASLPTEADTGGDNG